MDAAKAGCARKKRPCGLCDRTAEQIDSCPALHKATCVVSRYRVMCEEIYRARTTSCNYVANNDAAPTSVLFANGRTVKVVRGKLVVGWDREGAKRIFRG